MDDRAKASLGETRFFPLFFFWPIHLCIYYDDIVVWMTDRSEIISDIQLLIGYHDIRGGDEDKFRRGPM